MSLSRYRVAATLSTDFPVRVDIVREVLGGLAEVSEELLPFRPFPWQKKSMKGDS